MGGCERVPVGQRIAHTDRDRLLADAEVNEARDLAIREQLAIPVKFIGVGETPDDVEPFEPQKFVKAMFEG